MVSQTLLHWLMRSTACSCICRLRSYSWFVAVDATVATCSYGEAHMLTATPQKSQASQGTWTFRVTSAPRLTTSRISLRRVTFRRRKSRSDPGPVVADAGHPERPRPRHDLPCQLCHRQQWGARAEGVSTPEKDCSSVATSDTTIASGYARGRVMAS